MRVFEKVAYDFGVGKIVTTCTEAVSFKIPLALYFYEICEDSEFQAILKTLASWT